MAQFPPSAPFRAVFAKGLERAESHTQGHGREETRHLEVVPLLPGYIDWPQAAQLCRLTRQRVIRGKSALAVVGAITSLPRERAGAAALLALSRAHWSIENHLHFYRDVSFGEDAGRTRRRNAPQVLAALRNACLTVFARLGLRPVEALERFGENRSLALAVIGWRLPPPRRRRR